MEMKEELQKWRLEFVSREQFEALETRVYKLEQQQPNADNPDVKFLQTQLDRLDPVWKSIRLSKFKSSSVEAREKLIQQFVAAKLPEYKDRYVVEHVSKGPRNNRTLTDMAILEFPSKQMRDSCFKEVKEQSLTFFDTDAPIDFGFAKTKKQIRLDSCLYRAKDMIKTDDLAKSKNVEVVRHVNNDKSKRVVHVDGNQVFLQDAGDATGRFLVPFGHLFLDY